MSASYETFCTDINKPNSPFKYHIYPCWGVLAIYITPHKSTSLCDDSINYLEN